MDTTPTAFTPVRREAGAPEDPVRDNRALRAAVSTRSRSSSLTRSGRLKTFDTVPWLTPASRATSASLTVFFIVMAKP